MANGTPISEFTTFAASTGPGWATGPESIINDAQRDTYIYSRWIAGKDVRMDMVQGGSEINDTIFLDYKSTFTRTGSNPTIQITNPQTGTTWKIPWAIAIAHISWNEPELDLNAGGRSGRYRTQVYKRVLFQKHQNLWTDICTALDDEIVLNVPDYTNTEATTTDGDRSVYGLWTAINEYNNGTTSPYGGDATTTIGGLGGAGLIPAAIDAGGNDWTTVQQINPMQGDKVNWRPYQGEYGSWQETSTPAGEVVARKFFRTMSSATRKTNISRLPKRKEYSEPERMTNVIYTSDTGMQYVEDLSRTNQDMFRGMGGGLGGSSDQDPHYRGPTFYSIPFVYVNQFEQIPFFLSGDASTGLTQLASDGTTNADATVTLHTGPRFMGMNGDMFRPFVHEEKYGVMTDPVYLGSAGQPLSYAQYYKLYNNNICRSRRSHFMIRPDGIKNIAA